MAKITYEVHVNGNHVDDITTRSERRAIVEALGYVTSKNRVGLVVWQGREKGYKAIAFWDRGRKTK